MLLFQKLRIVIFQILTMLFFSYHGLPERQVNKIHPGIESTNCTCHLQMPKHGKNCYKATCYETTRLIAKDLGIEKSFYSVSFQSRLSKKLANSFYRS